MLQEATFELQYIMNPLYLYSNTHTQTSVTTATETHLDHFSCFGDVHLIEMENLGSALRTTRKKKEVRLQDENIKKSFCNASTAY